MGMKRRGEHKKRVEETTGTVSPSGGSGVVELDTSNREYKSCHGMSLIKGLALEHLVFPAGKSVQW